MTRRDVGKPAFSLRKQRFVKTHALSLLGTKNLRFSAFRFHDFQRQSLSLLPTGIGDLNIGRNRRAVSMTRKTCFAPAILT